MAKKNEETSIATQDDILAERDQFIAQRRAEDEAIAEAHAKAQETLDKLGKVKDEDFESVAADFWQPAKAGESLTGIFLGTVKTAKVNQYVFGVKEKNEHIKVRVNGGAVLTRYFAGHKGQPSRIQPLELVRIVYEGEKPGDDGRKVKLFDVQRLKNP